MEVPRPPRPARPRVRLQVRLGWLAGAAGAALLVLGWYGISGERYAERQLPYLASATVPGAALVVAAAVLLAGGLRAQPGPVDAEQQARLDELQRQLDLLTQLLAEQRGAAPAAAPARPDADPADPADPSAPPAPNGSAYYLVPGGRTFHRAGCLLLHGRQDVRPLEAEQGLRPCPLCDPRDR